MSNYYNDPTAKLGQAQSAIAAYQPSIRESFEHQLKDAQKNVARLQELLELFDRNPDLQRAMELMGRY